MAAFRWLGGNAPGPKVTTEPITTSKAVRAMPRSFQWRALAFTMVCSTAWPLLTEKVSGKRVFRIAQAEGDFDFRAPAGRCHRSIGFAALVSKGRLILRPSPAEA